jgi:hypothetical protein
MSQSVHPKIGIARIFTKVAIENSIYRKFAEKKDNFSCLQLLGKQRNTCLTAKEKGDFASFRCRRKQAEKTALLLPPVKEFFTGGRQRGIRQIFLDAILRLYEAF